MVPLGSRGIAVIHHNSCSGCIGVRFPVVAVPDDPHSHKILQRMVLSSRNELLFVSR